MALIETIRADVSGSCSAIDQDPRWLAVQRLIASKSFSKASRLRSLLAYVCRCALEGRSDEITEQQIGIHVFERPTDYNPGDDNIVRTTARQLRQRLALYYQEEGASDSIRIEIPRGGYQPKFIDLGEPEASSISALLPAETAPQIIPHDDHSQPLQLTRSLVILLLLLAVASGSLATLVTQYIFRDGEDPKPLDSILWSQLFVANKPTLFVAGDAGLNMYNNLARTQVTLGDYVTGSYLSTPQAQLPTGYSWASLPTRRYVSFVDLQFADRMRAIGGSSRALYSVRFARDMHVDDFRNANVILMGTAMYNPWVAMFDDGLNFHLWYDGPHNAVKVRNRSPRGGEPSEYDPGSGDPSNRGLSQGFGYIALTSNLEGNGKVLLIEGSTVAGVDAAVSFLLDDVKMKPILQQAAKNHGSLRGFEILLGANFLKSSSPDAHVLATRYY